MDANLKAKWVAALRSGEYQQGDTYLANNAAGTFCCLGVLCVARGLSPRELDRKCTIDVPFESGLSREIRSLLGDEMNDRERRTFSEIADWIEANIPADLPVAQGEG